MAPRGKVALFVCPSTPFFLWCAAQHPGGATAQEDREPPQGQGQVKRLAVLHSQF